MGQLAYIDSSAFVTLALGQPGYQALQAELNRWKGWVSSAILEVEAIRACARHGAGLIDHVREGLRQVSLVPLDHAVIGRAAFVEPASIRSLDAIHVGTALSLRDDVGMFIACDKRLLNAAVDNGLTVIAPR